MKGLKFRVWDSIEKRFLSTMEERRKITIFDNGMLSLVMREPLSIDDLSRYIPMHYIGFKDKNEQSIFEGDILEVAGGSKIIVESMDTFLIYCGKYEEKHDVELFPSVSVVGNIYENQ